MNIQNKIQLISTNNEFLQRFKDTWGVGKKRSDQARRLVDGDIHLPEDKDAIIGMAIIVNIQLALSHLESQELEVSIGDE
jgi:hypothetical protein